MKIEKLYTLSQFVELVSQTDKEHEKCYGNKEIFKEAKEKCVSMVVLIADKIIVYNNFLKQPLTKQMFVNEIEKPKVNIPAKKGIDHHNLIKYYEAEKKVIFEGFELKNNSINYKDIIHVFWYDNITQEWKLSNGMKTINDLAELLNNSELKLKNVEI